MYGSFRSATAKTGISKRTVLLLLFKVSLNKVAVRGFRDFKQIATATSTTTVVGAESWGEYLTVAR